MSAPQITPLPLAPSPSDPGDVFDAKAFALTSAWPDFINETNAAANYIEGGVDAVADSIAGATDTAINAAQSAASAASASQVAQYASEASSATAVGAANFKGSWAGLSGPLGLPSSVEHDGYFWVLLESVSDVTAHEPGAGGKWQIISSPTIRERLLKEATLNLDFANNKYEVYEGPVSGMTAKPFNDILNFTRSSGATAKTATDRKSTRLNSSHVRISYAVFCLKKKKKHGTPAHRRARTTPGGRRVPRTGSGLRRGPGHPCRATAGRPPGQWRPEHPNSHRPAHE